MDMALALHGIADQPLILRVMGQFHRAVEMLRGLVQPPQHALHLAQPGQQPCQIALVLGVGQHARRRRPDLPCLLEPARRAAQIAASGQQGTVADPTTGALHQLGPVQ